MKWTYRLLRSIWGRWIVKQAKREELRLAEMAAYGDEPHVRPQRTNYPKHRAVPRGRS